MVADLKAAHGYTTVIMVGDGATDMEARDVEGGADAFIGFGGIQVRVASPLVCRVHQPTRV